MRATRPAASVASRRPAPSAKIRERLTALMGDAQAATSLAIRNARAAPTRISESVQFLDRGVQNPFRPLARRLSPLGSPANIAYHVERQIPSSSVLGVLKDSVLLERAGSYFLLPYHLQSDRPSLLGEATPIAPKEAVEMVVALAEREVHRCLSGHVRLDGTSRRMLNEAFDILSGLRSLREGDALSTYNKRRLSQSGKPVSNEGAGEGGSAMSRSPILFDSVGNPRLSEHAIGKIFGKIFDGDALRERELYFDHPLYTAISLFREIASTRTVVETEEVAGKLEVARNDALAHAKRKSVPLRESEFLNAFIDKVKASPPNRVLIVHEKDADRLLTLAEEVREFILEDVGPRFEHRMITQGASELLDLNRRLIQEVGVERLTKSADARRLIHGGHSIHEAIKPQAPVLFSEQKQAPTPSSVPSPAIGRIRAIVERFSSSLKEKCCDSCAKGETCARKEHAHDDVTEMEMSRRKRKRGSSLIRYGVPPDSAT